MRRALIISVIMLTLTACASSPTRPQRSEFEDIPVPKGLTVDMDKSTIIESPAVNVTGVGVEVAARIFYKGRVEPDSLGTAFRTTLEANGWRHLSSTTASSKGTTQIYEKTGNSLQILIYEGIYYTWVELSATRFVSGSAQSAPAPGATPVPATR